jgi:tetratricopeptide (TPR) repeat protein
MEWLAQAATAVRSAYGRTSGYLTLGNLVSISWISIWVVICVLIFQDLSRDLVTIEPIATPKSFAEDGYTAEVASRRLHDALNKFADNAGTKMQNRRVESREELPDFIVPKIDLSLNAIVASIRGVLHYSSGQRITGEFVSRDRLLLRLRVDGREVFSGSGDPKDPDQLLAEAAPAVMEKIRPYIVASSFFTTDAKRAAEKADSIIARLKPSDVNVAWSYMLKGLYLADQKQLPEAEKAMRTALKLNWNNAVAHADLGDILLEAGRPDEAIGQYQRAVTIDPDFSGAYTGLGMALSRKGEIGEAIAEVERAIEIDPHSADAHETLGSLLSIQHRFDAAVAEFRSALQYAPEQDVALIEYVEAKQALNATHTGLGFALLNLQPDRKIDEAISEFALAIDSEPTLVLAHYGLGMAFRLQDKIDEAIGELQLCAQLDPDYPGVKDNLASALAIKRSRDSRP